MKRFAKARPAHTPGQMNKLEQDYALLLELRKRAGEIREYRFERVTFKLADDTRYTPDFEVITADDLYEYHEVKGFFREDSKLKVKVAAAQRPDSRFIVVTRTAKRDGGIWQYKDFSA